MAITINTSKVLPSPSGFIRPDANAVLTVYTAMTIALYAAAQSNFELDNDNKIIDPSDEQAYGDFITSFTNRNPAMCYIIPVSRTTYFIAHAFISNKTVNEAIWKNFFTDKVTTQDDTIYYICANKTAFANEQEARERLITIIKDLTELDDATHGINFDEQWNNKNTTQLAWLSDADGIKGRNTTVAAAFLACEELRGTPEPTAIDNYITLYTDNQKKAIYDDAAFNHSLPEHYVIPISKNLRNILRVMKNLIFVQKVNFTDISEGEEAQAVMNCFSTDTRINEDHTGNLYYMYCLTSLPADELNVLWPNKQIVGRNIARLLDKLLGAGVFEVYKLDEENVSMFYVSKQGNTWKVPVQHLKAAYQELMRFN